MKSNLQN